MIIKNDYIILKNNTLNCKYILLHNIYGELHKI